MSGREAPANQWPINQAALEWLNRARVYPEPAVAYLLQLARWGMDSGQVIVSPPISPQQPRPEDVREFVALLELARGPEAAAQATRRILSNPNLTLAEQTGDLLEALQLARNPEQAAQVVVHAIYDLMVVAAP